MIVTVTRDEQLTEHIIIGTPGTVMDWGLKLRAIRLEKIKVFVLDEADVMISMQGHQDQSTRIQKYVTSFHNIVLSRGRVQHALCCLVFSFQCVAYACYDLNERRKKLVGDTEETNHFSWLRTEMLLLM